MRVPAFPELSLRHLFSRPRSPGLFLTVYGKPATGFYHGRGALWRGLKLLGFSGGDTVLVPSYHCGVEIEAVRRAGVTAEFYRIKPDMSVDLVGLERRIRPGCRALLVIHYYGFAQAVDEIAALCRRRGLLLIEDCAHALFSRCRGKLLGTYGDAAVFSALKSLPLADGGALLVNRAGIDTVLPTHPPNQAVVWKRTLGLLAVPLTEREGWMSAALRAIGQVATSSVPAGVRRTYNTGDGFDVSMGGVGISGVSQRIMDGTAAEALVAKRRRHFQYLSETVAESDSWTACRRSLPEGTCPLFFPIRVAAGAREQVQAALGALGIGTYVFGEHLHPTLSRAEFPEAEQLSREILCLPIHQQLDEEELEFMAQTLNSLSGDFVQFHRPWVYVECQEDLAAARSRVEAATVTAERQADASA